MKIQEQSRVYALRMRDDDAVVLVFTDRATAHAWGDEHMPDDRWHVIDFIVWHAS